eukprot:jgi/Orpsp1_1/1176799/evm.model.c7180000059065.1
MNGMISDKLHELQRYKSIDNYNNDELATKIFKKIDITFHILKPKKIFGIFFDGVSPLAKMNLQRQRRIRELKKYKDKCSFNFNSTSCGTKFMNELTEKIQEMIDEKKHNNNSWKNVLVLYLGSNAIGEAEHNIFKYIKKQKYSNGNIYIYTNYSD